MRWLWYCVARLNRALCTSRHMKYKDKLKAQDVDIQSGNPNQLTWRQHFLPYACMKHFTDENNSIWVCKKGKASFRPLKRYEPGVVAARAWTQHIENTLNKKIESNFFKLQRHLLATGFQPQFQDNDCLNRYLALWRTRFLHHEHDFEDVPLNGITPTNFSADEREKSELRHGSDGGRFSGVDKNSILILRTYDNHYQHLKNTRWRLHSVTCDMEVVLPNTTTVPYLHLSPTKFLFPEAIPIDGGNPFDIASLNYQLMLTCAGYFYCRDLSKVSRT